jgi:anion-transporting  ArsA/GET3 family ATPase
MSLSRLFQSKLVFVTGKGGTGKTTLAAALARVTAEKGRRTLLCEVDCIRPALTAIFGLAPTFAPQRAAPNLDLCNITWHEALELWLEEVVPAQRIVKMILGNRIAQTFLDATPGAREIMVMARVLQLSRQYDSVVVDMPASGHAAGIFQTPHVAVSLMPAGPVGQLGRDLLQLYRSPATSLVVVGLPEEMVVNETLELGERLKREVPELHAPTIVLNRSATPTLTSEERQLLLRLSEAGLGPEAGELLLAGRWEAGLEASTAEALGRLQAEVEGRVVVLPRLGALGGFEGGPERVVRQVSLALLRQELAEKST